MRIYTNSTEIAFRRFDFPDGQPHLELLTAPPEGQRITLEIAIRNSNDLLTVLLFHEIVKDFNPGVLPNLDIRYLLGARMDRRINEFSPATLDIFTHMLNIYRDGRRQWNRIRVLDIHNPAKLPYLWENVLPLAAVRSILDMKNYRPVSPDKGARGRVEALVPPKTLIVPCEKTRDPETGALSGFAVLSNHALLKDADCLIIDDICDGGRTFTGLSKVLRTHGAKSVSLFVTHGIFSKGVLLEGIDQIFTTDSFYIPWTGLRDEYPSKPVCIPIFMKDLLA